MPPSAKMRLSRFLIAGIALASLTCQPWEKTVGSEDVRRTLSGFRVVQPRLSGLDGFETCVSSEDFIPVTRCGSQLDEELLARLRKIERQLDRQLGVQATADQLHGAALVRLVDFSRSSLVEAAVTYLREALEVEKEPLRQAELLTDLAGAHLLLAERFQSPLEVAAALEAALHALELHPQSPEALFNHQLSLVLLGLSDLDPQAAADRWIDELRDRLPVLRPKPAGRQDCLPEDSLRRAFAAWASNPNAETGAFLPQARKCWAGAEDRFYADLFDQAASDPALTAHAWKLYTLAEAALKDPRTGRPEASLRALEGLRPAAPIALAARRLVAISSYQKGDSDRARVLFERLAADATGASYFRLVGEAHRMLALFSQHRGEFGEAFRQSLLASEAARKAGSPTLTAGLASLRAEILERVGREDEAWKAVTEILRSSDQEHGPLIEMMALRSAARLAQSRGLNRVARALLDRGVQIGETLEPAFAMSSLRIRGELLLDLGQVDLARADLNRARKILAENPFPAPLATVLESDLLFLEGRVAGDPKRRRAALEEVVASYRAADYDFRILSVQLALAQLQRDQGDVRSALATLDAALGELAEEVAGTDQWSDAPALVAAARPLIEELVSLELEHRGAEDVRRTLGTVFGLRSGTAHLREDSGLPPGEQRLTTFALPDEVVVLLESDGGLFLERQPADRDRLGELRERLLMQLRNQVSEARLNATSAPLGQLLLEPVLSRISSGHALTIVADDVLAGLPFHLLPVGIGGELLLDRVAVRYATDLRNRPESPTPEAILAVGISETLEEVSALPFAVPEANEVGALYPEQKTLLNPDSESLRRAFVESDAVHFSGHFMANTRSPLDSYLLLGGKEGPGDRLTLRQLLTSPSDMPQLLYLSACDTGRGLPASAHGLASLAQAFSSAGIESTVLTLWPLNDQIAKSLAASFHRRLLAGEPAADALRAAQLEHRGEHPSRWGPLVLME